MRTAPLATVKDQLSAFVTTAQESPVIITRNGKPVALLTGIEDEGDLERILLVNNPRFLQILEEARARVTRTGGLNSEDFWETVARRRTSTPDPK
jgi:prevent-host-death family protein